MTIGYHGIDKWDQRFLDLAKVIAQWSKDPSTKVGCVIIRDRYILGTGYNGFPKGVNDAEYRYENRQTAERNAISNCLLQGRSPVGSTMYCTLPPCADCAKGIIQARIKRIVAPAPVYGVREKAVDDRWRSVMETARMMFEEAGVEVDYV